MYLQFPIPLIHCQQLKMPQRLLDNMRWLWCLLIIYSGPVWNPVRCITVRTPPKNPTTVEAQAKFFQDFFSVQLSPYKIEFGHVCEDPNTWEQRYEKKDFKNHRDMGKVRWGDKKGGYGEHYWDLNHAGHAGNHDHDGYSDDGSYHEEDEHDSYDEPSEQAPSYQADEYDPEAASKYDENNRAKRAHTKTKLKKTENNKNHRPISQKSSSDYEKLSDEETVDEYVAEASDEKETFQRIPKQKGSTQEIEKKEKGQSKEKNQIVLVVDKKENENQVTNNRYLPQQVEAKHYVPYEGGAGIRQHQHPEITASSAHRLFLEPSTGRVIDRTTGQAYVLQPLIQNTNYS